MNKLEEHANICKSLNTLYAVKNHDYGDSFGKSFQEWGLPMAAIRLGDKLNRITAFAKNKEMVVEDESIEDTLMDLANYAIMTVIELKLEKSKRCTPIPTTTKSETTYTAPVSYFRGE